MDNLIHLLSNIAPTMYLLGAAGTALGLLLLLLARRQLRWAQYPLEKENALSRGGCAITLLLIAAQLTLALWLMLNIFRPAYEEVTTLTIEATPFGAGLVFHSQGQAADGPSAPQIPPPVGCPADTANITSPTHGSLILEESPILGTASVIDFSHYRFEIMRAGETQFGVIGGANSDYDREVQGDELGTLDPMAFAAGEHRFRLVVFDRDNVSRASCEITLFLSEMPAAFASPSPSPAAADATAEP